MRIHTNGTRASIQDPAIMSRHNLVGPLTRDCSLNCGVVTSAISSSCEKEETALHFICSWPAYSDLKRRQVCWQRTTKNLLWKMYSDSEKPMNTASMRLLNRPFRDTDQTIVGTILGLELRLELGNNIKERPLSQSSTTS